MNNIPNFDTTKYFLGNLCIRGHEFFEGKTLRKIKGHACIACHNLKTKESYHRKNPELRKAKGKEKWLKYREQGLLRQKEWRKRNPDWQKNYRKTPKGKAVLVKRNMRKREYKDTNHFSNYNSKQLLQRYKDFDNCCAYCPNPATSIDHFIPMAKGGSDVLGNMVPACASCNSSKNFFEPYDWYSKQPFFSKTKWKKILTVLGKTDSTINQLPLF